MTAKLAQNAVDRLLRSSFHFVLAESKLISFHLLLLLTMAMDATHPDVVAAALAAIENVDKFEALWEVPGKPRANKEAMAWARAIRVMELKAMTDPQSVGKLTLNPQVFNADGSLRRQQLPPYGPFSHQLLLGESLPEETDAPANSSDEESVESVTPKAIRPDVPPTIPPAATANSHPPTRDPNLDLLASVASTRPDSRGPSEEQKEETDDSPNHEEATAAVEHSVEPEESEKASNGKDDEHQGGKDNDKSNESEKNLQGGSSPKVKMILYCDQKDGGAFTKQFLLTLDTPLGNAFDAFGAYSQKQGLDSEFVWNDDGKLVTPKQTLQDLGYSACQKPCLHGVPAKMTLKVQWKPEADQATLGTMETIVERSSLSMTTPFRHVFDSFKATHVKDPKEDEPLLFIYNRTRVFPDNTPQSLGLTVDSKPVFVCMLNVHRYPRRGLASTNTANSKRANSKKASVASSKKKAPSKKKVSFKEKARAPSKEKPPSKERAQAPSKEKPPSEKKPAAKKKAPSKERAQAPSKEKPPSEKKPAAKKKARTSARIQAKNSKASSGSDSDETRCSDLQMEDEYSTDGYSDSDSDSESEVAGKKGKRRTASDDEDFLMADISDSEIAGSAKKKRTTRKKRPTGEPAKTVPQQMGDAVRVKLDACVARVEHVQAMSRPAVRAPDYDLNTEDTEDTYNQKFWPYVNHGLYCYTEQRPNKNGGGKTAGNRRIKPVLSFFTGSEVMSEKMAEVFEAVKEGKVDVRFNAKYEGHKTVLFADPTIKAPQVNNAKKRKERGR